MQAFLNSQVNKKAEKAVIYIESTLTKILHDQSVSTRYFHTYCPQFILITTPPRPLPASFRSLCYILHTRLISHSLWMTLIPRKSWKQLLCKIWGVNKMYYGKYEIEGIDFVLSFWHWKQGFLGDKLKYFISDVTDAYSYRVALAFLGRTEGTRIDQGCIAISDWEVY